KGLSRDPDNRAPAILELAELAGLGDVWGNDYGAYLNLQSIIAQLHFDREPGAVEATQARMWLLALHLEEGVTDRTARALEEARRELQDLLDKQARGEQVDRADIDRAMRDVEQALEKHLEALAEQARRDPDSQRVDPETQQLDAQDMQRLAEEARKAMQEGRMDDARQKLAELDKMLQDLQNARPEHGQLTERERQRLEKRQRGQQQMNALQDMVGREGSLLDRAQGRDGTNDPRAQQAQQDFARRPFAFPPQRGFAPPDASPPASPSAPRRSSSNRIGTATAACSRRCVARSAS
ncbi:MAG: DUF4175 family protein, partial [Acidisphaera sp.]|nr:DUF4175 family protein [Acidisphaera sp.]